MLLSNHTPQSGCTLPKEVCFPKFKYVGFYVSEIRPIVHGFLQLFLAQCIKMKGFGRMLYMQATKRPKPLPDDLDLSGQTALVTGGNGGLGLEAAKDLAARRIAKVILSARSSQNETEIRKQITNISPSCHVELWIVDYEDYESMLAFGKKAANLESLHIVILNAGVRQLEYKITGAGHEQNLQVNHIGTALLSLLLLPILQETARRENRPTRLTIVTSVVHWWTPFSEYDSPSILARMDEEGSMQIGNPHDRYGTTKLLNILWMRQLASKVDPTAVIVNAVDPGLCTSNLHRYENRTAIHIVTSLFSWTSAQGGHNIANAAVVQGTDSHGAYVSSEQIIKE